MFYSLLKSETDTHPVPTEVTWEQLYETLQSFRKSPTKSGPAFIPSNTHSRRDADIRALEFGVFDLEGEGHTGLSDEYMSELCARLSGLDFILYSTYSPGCYRLLIRFEASVPVEHWASTWEWIVNHYQLPADNKAKNPGRIYWLPMSPDGSGWCERSEGKPLAVATIVSEEVEESPRDLPLENGSSNNLNARMAAVQPIDLDPLRNSLKSLRRPESYALAQKILKGEALALPGSRDNTINQAASMLAGALKAPVDAAMLLIEPSIYAMDCSPEGASHWLKKAKGCYERALTRLAEKMREEEKQKDLLLSLALPPTPPAVISGQEWRAGLVPKTNKEGEITGVKDCDANYAMIVSEDPAWRGMTRFNLLTKQIDVYPTAPVANEPSTLEVDSAMWLQRSAYKLNPHPQQMGPVLLSVARKNAYDPLDMYLRGLKWDGKVRAPTFLRDYLGSPDNEHTQTISQKWLVGAVARGLSPGCKMDTVLVLEAGQGAGKSRALHALATPFFSDTKINVNDKDSRMLANMVWIVELAELVSLKKAESETLKSFFSEKEGYFRPPYGKVLERFPRRAVFVGSTNEEEYLQDSTGNRRFWPVTVSSDISVESIMADRDQIWAEAVERYNANENWWLDKSQAAVAEVETSARLSGGESISIIMDWLLSKDPSQRQPEYRLSDVLAQAFTLMPDQISGKNYTEVGVALKKLGFTRVRKRIAGNQVSYYKTPAMLLAAAKTEKKGEHAHATVA